MKLTALAPFPFVGAEFGGGERIHNLLTRIDAELEVFIPNVQVETTQQHKNLTLNYYLIPEELRHDDFDFSVIQSAHIIKDRIGETDLVILEHPWQVDALSGQRFLYDAHNNETKLKATLFGKESAEIAARVETKALLANHVTFCSQDDNLDTQSPMTHIPNGTDIPKLSSVTSYRSKVLLFAGSAHPPNIGAAQMLANLGQVLPDYEIFIVGNCGNYIQTSSDNLRILGHVNAATLDALLRVTHAFVNPIAAGSGTSLKVAKALSYGVPVISSELGARGYADSCIIARNAQEVIDALQALKIQRNYLSESERAREASLAYSWDSIGERFNRVIEELAR